jgi:hypothetical protein
MLWFVLFFIWIWLLIVVLGDLFRSRDMGGWGKALWAMLLIFVPYLGVFLYIVVRGHKLFERHALEAKEQDALMRRYVKDVAANGSDSAQEIKRLAQLRAQGVLTEAEFERAKAKALG